MTALPRHLKINPALNDQKGSSLIEILVAMVLLATGFLGIGALFNYSIASNKNASSRLTASLLVQDYADLVRSNPQGFSNNNYNISLASFNPETKNVSPISSSDSCVFPNCNSTSIATQDRAMFRQRVKALLPAGEVVATKSTVGNTNALDIWIIWVEGKNVQDTSTSNDTCPAAVTGANPVPDPYPRCLYTRIAL